MRRYKMKPRVFSGYDEFYEDPQGEWVRYEDVADSLRAAYQNGYNKSTIDNQGIPRCNCFEYVNVKMGKSCVGIGWVCPAHGYKERLHVETKSKVTPLEY